MIPHPVIVEAAGSKPKVIEEFVGRPSTGTADLSVARMKSPNGINGAEYIAICLPAFSPETVHREG